MPQPNKQPAVVTSVPSRMSLATLVRGKRVQPPRIVLFGVEGIGKSTLGANAPKPIFLGAEDGTAQLDVTRFPAPENWQDALDAVRLLAREKHDFETLVIDTLDALEPMLWAHICARDKKENVEAYGYGKGYLVALDEWRILLNAIDLMRKAKPMNVVLIAHSWIKPFKNPEGDDFDRYEMKLHAKASGAIKEWSDAVLFANYETFANRDERTKRVKGISTGARVIHTERTAAFDAKNRYSLPATLPLSWPDLSAAIEAHAIASPEALLAEIERKIEQLPEDVAKVGRVGIERAGRDPQKLAQLNNWTNVKLAAQAEKEVA